MTRSIRRKITRRAAGLASPDCRTLVLPGTLRGFTLHYTGALSDIRADHNECDNLWRAFQAFHMADGGLGVPKGGCDIAYSHGICPHGFTFVGRGFWNRCGANGTTDSNRLYLALVIFGADKIGRKDVTAEATKSIVVYRKRLLTVHPRARAVKFHNQFQNTGCPGEEIRNLARRLWPGAF